MHFPPKLHFSIFIPLKHSLKISKPFPFLYSIYVSYSYGLHLFFPFRSSTFTYLRLYKCVGKVCIGGVKLQVLAYCTALLHWNENHAPTAHIINSDIQNINLPGRSYNLLLQTCQSFLIPVYYVGRLDISHVVVYAESYGHSIVHFNSLQIEPTFDLLLFWRQKM